MTFDHLAESYDDTFTHTQIGRWLRGRVHARLNTLFRAGDHVLELGCGTGEDALHLAGQGIFVVATDASPAMLAITRSKAHENPFLEVELLDLNSLPAEAPRPSNISADWPGYAGIFSDFGAVNVMPDMRALAFWLSSQLAPGGVVAIGVMGRFCLWEMLWHSLHLDFRTAFRRVRGHATFNAGASPITIYYPTLRQLKRDFSPSFTITHIESVGLFLPPSDVYRVIEKRPSLLNLLMNLEKRYSRRRSLVRFADHYWIEFKKK